ncbi:ion transporter [bacterium]|jgi:voltage-gated potassium channel|nr:ion transporter [bacterium]MBT6831649.1 ion transporter [bacterium]MBT6996295.1 ion transporter [bacterium]MBT7772973.1 ion transporter [bacterium]
MKKIRQLLTDLLENHESRAGRWFGVLLIVLIGISTGIFVLENLPFFQPYRKIFHILDTIVLTIFALEYFLRILIARNRTRFVCSFLGIIDLLVILPLFSGVLNITFLRWFRVFRILQMLKTIRYSDLMLTFLRSFRYYRDELRIFGITFGIVVFTSALGLFAFEHQHNPDFSTVPEALWWAVVTVTTVGYGDAVPVTVGGKLVAGCVMILGLATIALMTAILTKVFIDHFFGKRVHKCDFCRYPHHDHDAKFCKNCGNPLDVNKLGSADYLHPHDKVIRKKKPAPKKKN